jgi:hypothetical protein
MTISRLQNLEAVYQTKSANNEPMPQTRQMMTIELMQQSSYCGWPWMTDGCYLQ